MKFGLGFGFSFNKNQRAVPSPALLLITRTLYTQLWVEVHILGTRIYKNIQIFWSAWRCIMGTLYSLHRGTRHSLGLRGGLVMRLLAVMIFGGRRNQENLTETLVHMKKVWHAAQTVPWDPGWIQELEFLPNNKVGILTYFRDDLSSVLCSLLFLWVIPCVKSSILNNL